METPYSSRSKIVDYLSQIIINKSLSLNLRLSGEFNHFEELEIAIRDCKNSGDGDEEGGSTRLEVNQCLVETLGLIENYFSSASTIHQYDRIFQDIKHLYLLRNKLYSLIYGNFYHTFPTNSFKLALNGLKSTWLENSASAGDGCERAFENVWIPEEGLSGEQGLPEKIWARVKLEELVEAILGVDVLQLEYDEQDAEMDAPSPTPSDSTVVEGDEDDISSSSSATSEESENRFETFRLEVENSLGSNFRILHSISSKTFLSSRISVMGFPTITHKDDELAQSLISKKFAREPPSSQATSTYAAPPQPHPAPSTSSNAGSSSSSSSPHGNYIPHLYPLHMDFRILRTAQLRDLARGLFSTGVKGRWCRLHRVKDCLGCYHEESEDEDEDKREGSIGNRDRYGLRLIKKGRLVECLKDWIVLGARLLEMHKSSVPPPSAASTSSSSSSSEWRSTHSLQLPYYRLTANLITCSLLEGYLVDGWEGTDAVELLYGIGCGGWDPMGWSSLSVEGEAGDVHRAAKVVFGKFSASQADYCRTMRDRTHEMLNIPIEDTLETHLEKLNSKYPLSKLHEDVRNFSESVNQFLGSSELSQPLHNTSAFTLGSPSISSSLKKSKPNLSMSYYMKYQSSENDHHQDVHHEWKDEYSRGFADSESST